MAGGTPANPATLVRISWTARGEIDSRLVLDHPESGRWGRAALLAALVLVVSGCAAVGQPQASPSQSPASPSPSPIALPLVITSAAFHSGEVGVGYAPVSLAATGGVTPYTWTISAGALPGGLTLSSGGSAAGSPTHAGTFHFTVQVADSAGAKATGRKSIGIFAALKLSLFPACVPHCSVEIGCASVCGRFGGVSGGSAPYRFVLAGGYIPTGTALSGMSLAGTFAGSPSRWQFTVAVTDALGVTRTITPTFYVFAHISLANTTCSKVSTTCTLRYTGGVPGRLPSVKGTAWTTFDCILTKLPAVCAPEPAFTYTVTTGVVTITVTDSPSWLPTTGTVSLLITARDLCAANTYCSSKATLTLA